MNSTASQQPPSQVLLRKRGEEGEIVTTVSVEKGTQMQEATEMAKSVLAGAVFHGPVTLNINFK